MIFADMPPCRRHEMPLASLIFAPRLDACYRFAAVFCLLFAVLRHAAAVAITR